MAAILNIVADSMRIEKFQPEKKFMLQKAAFIHL